MGYGGFLTGRPGTELSGKIGIIDNFIANQSFDISYLVVGGGGAGGGDRGGAGGAGGYRNSYASELSGRNSSTETPLKLFSGTYSLEVGSGGANGGVSQAGQNGNPSTFATIESLGGGGGGKDAVKGSDGGSGGGGSHSPTGGGYVKGLGTANQGFDGGNGDQVNEGAGGGGAGEAGSTDGHNHGGDGLASNITGTSIFRAGGGGSAAETGDFGPGGQGGGGRGADRANNANIGSGEANTGGGGGGGSGNGSPRWGANGGSGVIIFRAPSNKNVTFSAGVVEQNGGSGSLVSAEEKVYVVTAAGPTDTVTIG